MNNSPWEYYFHDHHKHQLASHCGKTIIIAGKCGKPPFFPVELGQLSSFRL
jgi:hypothetical protein